MHKRTSDQVVRVRLRDPPVNYAYLVVPASGYQTGTCGTGPVHIVQYAVIHRTSKQDADHPVELTLWHVGSGRRTVDNQTGYAICYPPDSLGARRSGILVSPSVSFCGTLSSVVRLAPMGNTHVRFSRAQAAQLQSHCISHAKKKNDLRLILAAGLTRIG